MNRNKLTKIVIAGFMTFLMASNSMFANANAHTPSLDAETTSTEEKVSVSEEEILKQLEHAESLINQEEKDAFKAKWDAMTPQEKHDYLMPIFLDELNSLHTKLKIAENEVYEGHYLDMSFLQFYQSDINDFYDRIFAISDVQDYEYSAYKPLKKAAEELYTLAPLVDLMSAGYLPSREDYDNHWQYYNEFYNQAYEISLMREYDIAIDQSLDRVFQEIAIAHQENLERYKKALDTVIKCVDLYSKGGTDSTLYRAAKNINQELYVDFNIRDTSDFSSIQIDENDDLTPLAYEVVESLRYVSDTAEDYFVYAMTGSPSKMQTQMNTAIAIAQDDLKHFEAQCNLYLEAGEQIDQNIFETIEDIKADRKKTALANGYDSWELYQIHLEAVEKAEHDNRVKEKATELAVIQKEYEEEMRRLEEEARAEWLRNRLDFSKPLSQQNHSKGYYMDIALSHIESNAFLSSFADLSLNYESRAFDELFRIRANGGNTSLLQRLYDSHPNDFSLIRDLYHYYK